MVCLSKLLEPLEKGLGIQFSGVSLEEGTLGTSCDLGCRILPC